MAFDFALLIPYLRLAILFLGFYVNFDFVYITIVAKSLHSACNILLAMEALTNGVYSIFNIGTFITKTFGVVFSRYNCFLWIALPVYISQMNTSFVFSISADRLLCICFPIWYKNKKTMPHMFVHFSISFAYSTFLFFNQYKFVMQDANTTLAQCIIQEITPVEVLTYSLIMNGWAIFNYLLFLSAMSYKFITKSTNLQIERITKCVLAILTMILFGWNWAQVARFLRPLPMFPPIFFDIMACIVLLFLGINPVVFYVFNKEYRFAFLKHYGWIVRLWQCTKKQFGICSEENNRRMPIVQQNPFTQNNSNLSSNNNGADTGGVPIRSCVLMRQVSVYPRS